MPRSSPGGVGWLQLLGHSLNMEPLRLFIVIISHDGRRRAGRLPFGQIPEQGVHEVHVLVGLYQDDDGFM